jgi:hypothetical protein
MAAVSHLAATLDFKAKLIARRRYGRRGHRVVNQARS